MDSENTVISPGDLVALIDHAESGDAMACITLGRLYYEAKTYDYVHSFDQCWKLQIGLKYFFN